MSASVAVGNKVVSSMKWNQNIEAHQTKKDTIHNIINQVFLLPN